MYYSKVVDCLNFLYLIQLKPSGASIAGYLMNNPNLGDEPIDIEDLVNIGKRHGP